jgi:sugar lactone lactonase YvrE
MRLGVVSAVAAIVAAVLAPPAQVGGSAAPPTRVVLKGLKHPTGLAFNPHDGALWIVDSDRGGAFDKATIVTRVGSSARRVRTFVDFTAHYMAEPTGIAFSPTRNEVATSALLGGGPTLWTADLALFRNGRQSHLDMVHRTQPAMGIAAGADSAQREYWVFNGHDGSIDRYFFHEPHPLGEMDHRDGRVYRYAANTLRSVPGAPGHVVFDSATNTLYIADTGHGRVARFHTDGLALEGRGDPLNEQGVEQLYHVDGGRVETLVGGLRQPSGLALVKGHLVVGEFATGRLSVFTLDGKRKKSFLTGVGARALTGIAAAPDGRVYVLDGKRGRLLRVERALP